MSYSHWEKILNQIRHKPAKLKKWKKHNVPKTRSVGKSLQTFVGGYIWLLIPRLLLSKFPLAKQPDRLI